MGMIARTMLLFLACLLPAVAAHGEGVKMKYVESLYVDAKGVALGSPQGIACNSKLLLVGDARGGRLVRYLIEGGGAKADVEMKPAQLSTPIRVRLNSKGEIYVLDASTRRILRLDAEGALKGSLSLEGIPGQSASVPRSFAVGPDDKLYVVDVFSERVLILSPDGKYERQMPFPKEHGFFSDIAVDAKGTVLLIDTLTAKLYSAGKGATAFSPLGNPLREYLDFPVGLLTDGRGTIYVLDGNGGVVVVVGQDGSFMGRLLGMGRMEGLLYYPTQACINERGEFFIADRGNSRVQEFAVIR
jgi:DNA-binding beta-propeller fold protein YncE